MAWLAVFGTICVLARYEESEESEDIDLPPPSAPHKVAIAALPEPHLMELIPELSSKELDALNDTRRWRIYPGADKVQGQIDESLRADEAQANQSRTVRLKLHTRLDDLLRKERVLTNQTKQRQALWTDYDYVKVGQPPKVRKQLRAEYLTTNQHLRKEQEEYIKLQNWSTVPVEEYPAPPTPGPGEFDCGTIEVNLVNVSTTVQVPNLIPGCAEFHKAFKAHQEKEKERYKNAQRTGRKVTKEKEAEAKRIAEEKRKQEEAEAEAKRQEEEEKARRLAEIKGRLTAPRT